MSYNLNHHVEVVSERSHCGSPGHTDLVATCSCGWTERFSHGDRQDVSRSILYHRVAALEKAIGMKFTQDWKAGT